jgi:hypothetical protein
MPRKLYTKEEITLCIYIARFGRAQFDESDIQHLENRSVASIKMKVSNIAAMLVEEGHDIHQDIPTLTGKTTGKKGRKTNWDIVSNLVYYKKERLFDLCQTISDTSS